jgi:hypothetical protein
MCYPVGHQSYGLNGEKSKMTEELFLEELNALNFKFTIKGFELTFMRRIIFIKRVG